MFYPRYSLLPQTIRLVGPDAQHFIMQVSSPSATFRPGQPVTLEFELMTGGWPYDYDNPTDANRDNVYSFTLQADFSDGNTLSKTLSTSVNAVITDVLDGYDADSVVIQGEAINQMFGAPIARIPDITGDGKEEIGVAVVSNRGPASAYVVSSEFYGSIPKGLLSVSTLGTQGTRFKQTPTAPAGEIVFRNGRANLLTAEKGGAGVDLLLSDAERKAFYLFQLSGPADYAALRGDIDPATVANSIVYSADPAGHALQARLIGDVNGDDLNDIFVQEIDVAPDTPTTYGIIFGRVASTPADRTRSANAFDISFNAITPKGTSSNNNEIPRLIVQKLSDITGDGFPELVIAPSVGGFLSAGVLHRTSWLIKSPILRGPTPRTVSLTAPSADPVTFMQNITPNAIVEIPDQDGDGLKTLVMNEGTFQEGVKLIDGDDLNAVSQTIDMSGPGVRKKSIGSGFMAPVGDLDGDGMDDFVLNAREFGLVARHAMLSSPQTTMPNPDPAVPGSEWFRFVSLPVSAQSGDSWPPLRLAGSSQIAFGFVEHLEWIPSNQTLATTAGQIVIVKEEDFRRNIATAMPGPGSFSALRIH